MSIEEPGHIPGNIRKMITYDPENLAGWNVLLNCEGTALTSRTIWSMLLFLNAITWSIALSVVLFIPNARYLDTNHVSDLAVYLKVFIAFMLGIFMNRSLSRWWGTVTAVQGYFGGIKKLIFALNATHVPTERRDMIMRYALLSSYCLHTELANMWQTDPEKSHAAWDREFDHLTTVGLLQSDSERRTLLLLEPEQRTFYLWTWAAQALMLAREEQPKGLSPSMVPRMLEQMQELFGTISDLKTRVTVQMPFMYTHMLALLVHVNNVILAVSAGFAMGSAFSEIVDRQFNAQAPYSRREIYEALQVVGFSLVSNTVEPLIYMCFLLVGARLCHPFGNTSDHLPILRYIEGLEIQMHKMNCVSAVCRTTGVSLDMAQALKAKLLQRDGMPEPAAPEAKAAPRMSLSEEMDPDD